MNEQIKIDLLSATQTYSGEGISVRLLEETISSERTRQNTQIQELSSMRSRNVELQQALAEEMAKLKNLSEQMNKARQEPGFFGGLLAKIGIGKSAAVTRRSIEELLRNQYELSSLRLKEASEFVDRLEASKIELYNEVERLGRKIVESAENEEQAAAYVVELKNLLDVLESKLTVAAKSSAEERKLQLDRDRTRRLIAEHTTLLKLYSTAEERLDKLKRNTWQLAETITHLQGDISRYVTAASEKMDLIAGQIQAIGAAADASMVMIELKQSLDAMTESVNYTTRFVAETQLYFRENVDSMIEDLQIYDAETEAVLNENMSFNEAFDELDVEQALSAAIAKKAALAEGGQE